MYHLDIELSADRYELEYGYTIECAAELALAPIAACIRADGNDYGKLVRIWTPSGWSDVSRLEPHTLLITADARLLVDSVDMSVHAVYWLGQLSSAVQREVVAPAGRYAPASLVRPSTVRLTNPAFPKGFRVELQWLRSDPCRVQGRRNRMRA